ncbi:MarR family winged helix-turn-helix transcriptional regulator [Acetanaerobacterium elongatum]|uniref:DNA-binding transcriptional regulator, MarR family n=1 Tax=Acetanaerobacterium elongatum TaxID=258515 RepID=A0A1G9UMJ2_9FIRM|nr:MarR family winged helix-turn-helix transcriptional regulator [Acetanaerobacterium elongatum]SDM61139.1 DNA-binding transcriptional regulator, MarR family [Acetanaerobacterium elongatum]
MKQFLIKQIFATVFSLNNKIQEESNKLSGKITLRQFMLMLAVEHIPSGERSYNMLAKKLGTTKQNAKQLVESLQRKQYVCIEPHATDKRAVNISLTPAGLQAALEFAEASDGFLNRAAEKFTTEELEQLWALLKRFYAFDGIEMDGFDNHEEETE